MQHQFVVTGIKLLSFRDFSWYKIVYMVHGLSCEDTIPVLKAF